MTKQELEVALQAAVAAWNSDKPGLTLQGELEARGLRIVPAEPVAWDVRDTNGDGKILNFKPERMIAVNITPLYRDPTES